MKNTVWQYQTGTKGQAEHFRFIVDIGYVEDFETQLKNLRSVTYKRGNDKNTDAYFDVFVNPRAESAEYKQLLSLGEKQLTYLGIQGIGKTS